MQVCGGRNPTPTDSDVCILDIHGFCDTNLNFNFASIETDRGMRTVELLGIGVMLIAYIPAHGIM